MAKVKVLLIGIHEEIDGVFYAGSTVSLVKSENKNILIDTGSFGDREKLIEALNKEGLKPDNIDIIIATHTHFDHSANLNLFENAKIVTKHSPQSSGAMFYRLNTTSVLTGGLN